MGMENGKSPGIDGLPIEFYKTFWPVLREDLLVVFDEALLMGFFPLVVEGQLSLYCPKKAIFKYKKLEACFLSCAQSIKSCLKH